MSDLSTKFATLESQLASQAATIQGYVDDVEEQLALLNNQIDTLNINGAVNTRALLAALAAIDPCATCPPPSILIPPIPDDIVTPDDTTCKKAQAFIAYMQGAMVMLDLVSGLGTGTFPSLLMSAYQELIDSSAPFDGVPLISFTEGVNLIGRLINYGITNIGRGDTLAEQFASVSAGLLPVLYSATSATEAKSLYASYMAGTGLPADEIAVMTAAAYDGLFSWFFSPEGTPDLSSYSGGVCGSGLPGITECVDIVATKLLDDGFFRYFLLAPPASDNPHETAGDFFGFQFETLTDDSNKPITFVYRPVGGGSRTALGSMSGVASTFTIGVHTSAIDVYTNNDGEVSYPFSIRICPPE